TGCFRVVAPGSPSDQVLIGQVNSVPNMGWTIPVQFLEGLTLTPIFGVPVPMRGTGEASANIYDHASGELVSSVSTGKIPLTGWTTILHWSSRRRARAGDPSRNGDARPRGAARAGDVWGEIARPRSA